MILIPVESDQESIAKGFRDADMFVFLDTKVGIVVQDNHYKEDTSELFFENFATYEIDTVYVKSLAYESYLELTQLGVKVSLVPEDITLYTHIDPNELILLTEDNAEIYCTMGQDNKEED